MVRDPDLLKIVKCQFCGAPKWQEDTDPMDEPMCWRCKQAREAAR